ncbi:hypothetical protein HYW59_00125 [Candidatus Kaiserbacteria bacterium]|nr:hypothetical protein [Candidatus Kaiserbacteria bacterium]
MTKFDLPLKAYADEQEFQGKLVAGVSLSRVLDQFSVIHSLENKYPGSIKELHSRFGLRRFSRYPAWVLEKQYLERDEVEKPCGVFMSGMEDAGNVFASENDRVVVESTTRQLQELGCAVRFIECNGKQEMFDYFKLLDSSYGTYQKIPFWFIRSHAGRWDWELGANDDDGHVNEHDFAKEDFKKMRDYFSDQPTIIFDGCSLGRKGGIAQKTSEFFDAEVLAPKGMQSALTSIAISKQNDRLIFRPLYDVDREKEVAPHVYLRGRKR